jgi:site-specific DNA recombinase
MNEFTPKPVQLIAVYARVSTARQEEEGTIETQLSAVREFAGKNNYAIVKDYVDNGWSGDLLARPALDQLREDAKKKLWQAVLIYDPDRLARRYSFQELVMDELRELGIETLFVTVSPSRNHEDRLMYGVRGIFAEYERTKIAERFRLEKARKAKEGHIVTSQAPYGYTLVTKRDGKNGYFLVNEREAEIVRKMFSFVADEGLTIRQLIRRLQELCIPPRNSPRGVWSTSKLSTLFRNRTYIGEAHFGASYAVVPEKPLKRDLYRKIKKTSRRMRPESEWIIIPAPAIVDKDLFMRVQKRLKDNYAMASRKKKYEYLLAGKIRCVCGRSRTGESPKPGKNLYYRCADRIRSFPLPPACARGGINSRIVDSLVWGKVAELMSSKELMLKEVERWTANRRSALKESESNPNALREVLRKLIAQEERYTRAYAAGMFSIERLQEYIAPLKAKVAAVEGKLAGAQTIPKEANTLSGPEPEEIEAFAAKAALALQNLSFEQKRRIVMNVIDKVVASREVVEVFGYIPITDHVELCSSNRDVANATRYDFGRRFIKSIPFNLTIPLPPPLKRGFDYGGGRDYGRGGNASSKVEC